MSYSVGKRRGLGRIILAVITILLGVGVATAAIAWNRYNALLSPVSSSSESKPFVIAKGASAKQIGAELQTAGLIKDSRAFEIYARVHDVRDKLQAGEYYLRPNMTVAEIVGIISQGKVATDLVTILPGKRIDQVRQSFIDAGFSEQEVDAALNPAAYAGHPVLAHKPADATLEGYLYPESYQKTASTKLEVVIRQSLDLMAKQLTPEVTAGIAKQNLSVHQGIILASVIEKEVGKLEDRPKVAQVFLKRLSIGMRLQSDATAPYGAVLAGLKPIPGYESPYNTYKNDGLMPGPISNVSGSSLRAVANPAATDFLFFVSGDDGINYFSSTAAEHEANVAAHCFEKCGRVKQ